MEPLKTITAMIGTIVALATFANAAWQFRRKVHLEIFRKYADKYNEILTPAIYEKWLGAIQGDRSHWSELTPTMIMYLNLVWEERFLVADGAIPKRLWNLWLPEIERVISSEFARVVLENYDFHFPSELTV